MNCEYYRGDANRNTVDLHCGAAKLWVGRWTGRGDWREGEADSSLTEV